MATVQENGLTPGNYINQALSSQGDGTGVIDQVIASQQITSASDASPNVYTLNGHGFLDGDHEIGRAHV